MYLMFFGEKFFDGWFMWIFVCIDTTAREMLIFVTDTQKLKSKNELDRIGPALLPCPSLPLPNKFEYSPAFLK